MQFEVRMTEDGSHTLYVEGIDECYHSTHGAVQESAHIFITDGLKTFASTYMQDENCELPPQMSVLEVGFGTGLNAYLTILEAERLKIHIHYTSIELYPLSATVATQLNYPEILGKERDLFEKIHGLSWGEVHRVSSFFSLYKVQADFITYELRDRYDVIYFDAFSPEKQPEMWSEQCFGKLYNHCNENAVLTTYCAKGAVRRAMQSAGFIVERLPGPPGKREVLRGKYRK